MGRLIYESRGIAKKAKVVFTVCSILLAVMGVLLVIIANMKRSAGNVYSSIGGGTRSYMGSYGGGYVLGDSGRSTLQFLGIIFVLLGILIFFNMLSMNKSYLSVYENGIKGMSVAGLLIVNLKKEYELEYSEIENVKLNRNPIYGDTITVWNRQGEHYGLFVEKDAERVAEIIKQSMGRRAY